MAVQEDLFKISNFVNHSAVEHLRKIIGLQCELYRTVEIESIYTDMSQQYEVENFPYLIGRFIVAGLVGSTQLQFFNTMYTNIMDNDTFMIFSPQYVNQVELNSIVDIHYGNNIYRYKIQDLSNFTMQDNQVTYLRARLDPIT